MIPDILISVWMDHLTFDLLYYVSDVIVFTEIVFKVKFLLKSLLITVNKIMLHKIVSVICFVLQKSFYEVYILMYTTFI